MRSDPAPAPRNGEGFVLYVEGARDRHIVQAWSYRLLPGRARQCLGAAVILGGRRPARAVEHFRRLRAVHPGIRALCVLDRDDGRAGPLPEAPDGGLEFFTWSRRHIESYLLVPAAIHRALHLPLENGRLGRVLDDLLPPAHDEEQLREIDAKRLLGPGGVIERTLARRIPLGLVARATREEELHPDVHALFGRLRDGIGLDPL